MVFDKVIHESNPKIMNISLTLDSDGNHGTALSGLILLFKTVYDWKAELTFYKFDDIFNNYKQETFRTSINITNAFGGFRGNYWMTPILENFVKSFDNGPDLKFPLTPRNYTLNNLTIPSNLMPPVSAKFKVEFKNWMKVVSIKTRKMEFAALVKIYGKLN